MSSPEGSSPQSLRTWSTTSSSSRPAPHGSRPATGRPPRERRSPSARSRGGNHVSPTCPLLRRLAGGTSRFPRKGSPSPRSRGGDRRVNYALIAIGTSWGGLQALSRLLSDLPSEIDQPIVIAQHRAVESSEGGLAHLLEQRTDRA